MFGRNRKGKVGEYNSACGSPRSVDRMIELCIRLAISSAPGNGDPMQKRLRKQSR
jgi:hypothetical protein